MAGKGEVCREEGVVEDEDETGWEMGVGWRIGRGSSLGSCESGTSKALA